VPDISAIQNTPDVSFIDNKTIDDVRGDMVADFEAFMLQATGSKVSLGRASVHRMILYSAAAQIYQAMQYVDRAGKQSLLKYSYSEFLDNLALLKGVTREPAKAATTTIRFTASATRTLATPIPAGTRVSSSGSIYFSTMEYAEIPAGSLILTSDDVFDYMLDVRAINDNIDTRRGSLFDEYTEARTAKFQMHSMEDYDRLKQVSAARRYSKSQVARKTLSPNIRTHSNGESAFLHHPFLVSHAVIGVGSVTSTLVSITLETTLPFWGMNTFCRLKRYL